MHQKLWLQEEAEVLRQIVAKTTEAPGVMVVQVVVELNEVPLLEEMELKGKDITVVGLRRQGAAMLAEVVVVLEVLVSMLLMLIPAVPEEQVVLPIIPYSQPLVQVLT